MPAPIRPSRGLGDIIEAAFKKAQLTPQFQQQVIQYFKKMGQEVTAADILRMFQNQGMQAQGMEAAAQELANAINAELGIGAESQAAEQAMQQMPQQQKQVIQDPFDAWRQNQGR